MDKFCSILIGLVILLAISYATLRCYDYYKKVTYKTNYKKYIYQKVKSYSYDIAFREIDDLVCSECLFQSLINYKPKYNHFLLLNCISFMFSLIDSGFIPCGTKHEAVCNILSPVMCSILENNKVSFEDANIQINNYKILSISKGSYSREIKLKNEIEGNTFTVYFNDCVDSSTPKNYEFLFDETRVLASDCKLTSDTIREEKKTGAWQNA